MIAKSTAIQKSNTANLDSFLCRGVPTFVPKNAPVIFFVDIHVFCNHDLLGSCEIRPASPCKDFAILPISLFKAVLMTIPFALPLTTVDEENAKFKRSPTEVSSSFPNTKSASLETGKDSPVSSDSSVSKFLVSIKRKSAGIVSPTFTRQISPGTTSLEFIVSLFPFLIT